MKLATLFFLIAAISSLILGQPKLLKVIASSGDVVVRNKGEVNWSKVFVNDSFSLKSKIKLSSNSYVCFVDSNLNTFEIKKPGEYKVSFIDSLLTSKNNSVNKKIKQFFLHEILTKEEKFKEMHVLGSVIRSGAKKIDVPIPNSITIIDSSISLTWFPHLKNDKYLLYLFNANNDLLYMNEILDTFFVINNGIIDFGADKEYKWFVQSLTDQEITSDTLTFRTVSEKKKKLMNEKLAVLKEDQLNMNSPINNIVLAKFFENENIFSEAEKYYKNSIEISPATPLFWYEYIQFLNRNHLYHKIKVTLEKSPFQNLKTETQ